MASQSQPGSATDILTTYILTYNCARALVDPNTFAPHLFHALPSPNDNAADFLVLCLQEIAPISYAFLGGSFLTPYLNAWREVVRLACTDTKDTGRGDGNGHGYVNIATRNIGMTAIMLFARDDIAEDVKWTTTAGVGVGVSEMGNKGAVGVRVGYQPSSLDEAVEFTFVSAHLAPMEDGLERRNRDYKSIVEGLVFVADSRQKKAVSTDEQDEDAPLLQGDDPSQQTSHQSESGMYSASSYLFVAGDLNYRTSLLQPSPQDVDEKFPHLSANEADAKHFRQLLAEDQLTQQLKAQKTLHRLSEAPITFPPTYKYNTDGKKAVIFPEAEDAEDDSRHWSWARHRWPSWCDRILFWNDRGSGGDVKVTSVRYTCLPLFSTSDHRPVAFVATVPLRALQVAGRQSGTGSQEELAPFSTDANWKSRRAQARQKELVVGLAAYLALTWEGRGLLVATAIGLLGGWLIIRSLLMG